MGQALSRTCQEAMLPCVSRVNQDAPVSGLDLQAETRRSPETGWLSPRCFLLFLCGTHPQHSTIVFNTVGKDGCGPCLPGTSDLAGTDVKRMNSKIKILSDGAKFLCRNGAGSYDGEDLI